MQNDIPSLSGIALSIVNDDDFKLMLRDIVQPIADSVKERLDDDGETDKLLHLINYMHLMGFRNSLTRFVEMSDKSRKYCAGDVVRCFTTCPAYVLEQDECAVDMIRDEALDTITAPLLLADAIADVLYDVYREEIEKLPIHADDDEPVPNDGWDDVCEYCKNDIAATEEAIKAITVDPWIPKINKYTKGVKSV